MKAIDVRYNARTPRDLSILKKGSIKYEETERAKRKLSRNGCPESFNDWYIAGCAESRIDNCMKCWRRLPGQESEDIEGD